MLTTPCPDGLVRLADWGVIRAEGADALSFLQGQLTQDVTALPADRARLAGYCSAKGRLLATFVLWRADDGAPAVPAVDLACSADLLAATLKRLSMFVLRAKCKLSDRSGELALYGLAGASATRWLAQTEPAGAATIAPWGLLRRGPARVIRLPDAAAETGGQEPTGRPRYLLAQPAALPAPDLPALSADDWAWLEVHSGVARITAATVEAFVPQMVNLELVGGVNFQKGCYPGQEVVARSQYRGTLKRRAMVFDSAAMLVAGQELFHSDDPSQPAGRVVLAAKQPGGGGSALVEVKLAALEAGSLHTGVAAAAADSGPPDSGQLVRGALPYAIPADQG